MGRDRTVGGGTKDCIAVGGKDRIAGGEEEDRIAVCGQVVTVLQVVTASQVVGKTALQVVGKKI